jgi:hypothetical protein
MSGANLAIDYRPLAIDFASEHHNQERTRIMPKYQKFEDLPV